MELTQIDKAVYGVLAYTNYFQYPLLDSEIFLKQHSKDIISSEKINQSLKKITAYKLIACKNRYYFIKDTTHRSIYNRNQRERTSISKLNYAQSSLAIILKIPWLKSLIATGSVAAGNAIKEDDIDILIITDKNRLWIVRLLVIVILELKGIRRRPNDRTYANKICFNMILEAGHEMIVVENQNIFTAYELLQTKVLYDDDNCYHNFLTQNKWVAQFMANWYKTKLTNYPKNKIKKTKNNLLNISLKILLNKINYFLYQTQRFYMSHRRTNELVNLHQALFHPSNVADKILTAYRLSKKSIY